ncbi:MAG TPA: glycine cleavage system aminomethyltransferase GcvT [Flavobacteriales bacterium]|jgi:aminomethyltransferase|nr:glycine cleavage system aminomethyltransferase GcvT [Flavobacteriales bacterium]
MEQLVLNDIHVEMGGKMVPFAGYSMPVQFSGLIDEHHTVRNAVGVFDVSHMGEFFVRGPGAQELVQRITSNDVSKLFNGKVQYSCFPNERGGIVDDLLVYQLDNQEYMLVVNGANVDKDWAWVIKNNKDEVNISNESKNISLFAIQGPKATEVLSKLTNADLASMKYYTVTKAEIAGIPDLIVSTTGYTGSGGYEVYVQNEKAEQLYRKILEAGQEFGLKPIGLGARDTLRLEMGFCLYGNDITDDTSPIEAGLGWITKLSEDNDFVGRAHVERIKSEGVKRRLVGFELSEKGIPRKDYPIFSSDGEEIGIVTSGTMAPSVGKAIGMGYVSTGHNGEGNQILIGIRKKKIPAKVVKFPFYKG